MLSSCVLGLFPMANQSLIRDTQEMQADRKLSGPVVSFSARGRGAVGKQSPATRESKITQAGCE